MRSFYILNSTFCILTDNLGQKATRSLKAGLRPSRSTGQPSTSQPSTGQPWPKGHAIAFNRPTFNRPTFNLITFNRPTLAKRPRDRVQPANGQTIGFSSCLADTLLRTASTN
ncbi:MAG: hypothetical protein F6J90_32845 [Moorea sp. SIOASIH]|uniref:hypothetical protein n=1 Tax=Moorena sp. SIOASIH TaxID=2607817 RepID=UPI0013B6A1F7|nr:hypothetical protein [Moorena sp. SIOASIH]NEO40868.1 hypothetical protein [Moorena sp. SIOASIH]